jgi:hypothetical protein
MLLVGVLTLVLVGSCASSDDLAALDARLSLLEGQLRAVQSDLEFRGPDEQLKILSDELADLANDVDRIEGFNWNPVVDEDLTEIGRSLGFAQDGVNNLDVRVRSVESCIESIVNVLNGFANFVFC